MRVETVCPREGKGEANLLARRLTGILRAFFMPRISRPTNAPSPARDPSLAADRPAPTDEELEREYEEFKPSLRLSARAARAVIEGYKRNS